MGIFPDALGAAGGCELGSTRGRTFPWISLLLLTLIPSAELTMATQGWATPPPLPQSQSHDKQNHFSWGCKCCSRSCSGSKSPLVPLPDVAEPPSPLSLPASSCGSARSSLHARFQEVKPRRHPASPGQQRYHLITGKNCSPGVTRGLTEGLVPLVCTEGTIHVLPAESCIGISISIPCLL